MPHLSSELVLLDFEVLMSLPTCLFKGLLQTTADEFCFYYARKDAGLCFPDFPRKQVRGPASNYLGQMEDYEKVGGISRSVKF